MGRRCGGLAWSIGSGTPCVGCVACFCGMLTGCIFLPGLVSSCVGVSGGWGRTVGVLGYHLVVSWRMPLLRVLLWGLWWVSRVVVENCTVDMSIFVDSCFVCIASYLVRSVDALAPRADEGRCDLR